MQPQNVFRLSRPEALPDVCGALPKEFDKSEWDVRVVIPNYSCIPESFRNEFRYVTHFYMSTGSYIQNKYVGVLQYELDGIKYYFIDNQEYFDSFSSIWKCTL